jgi:glycine cleavage system H protein
MTIVKYTKEHEYIRIEDGVGTVGISVHAAEQLGDVVFVELPEIGKTVKQGEQAAVVESVKAASEVYAPASGEVVAVNDELPGNTGLVNEDAEGAAWFFKLKIADAGELDSLMDEAAYRTFIGA